jgi:hypothetical protein
MNLRLHKSSKKSDEISGSSIFFYGKSLLKKNSPISSATGGINSTKGRSCLTTGLYIQK